MNGELLTVEVMHSGMPPVTEDFDYNLIADPEARDWAESAAGFITFGLGQAVVKVLEAGNLLMEAKQRLKHGEYLPWVEQACGLSRRRAAELVKAAEWVQMSGLSGHLPDSISHDTLFLLSADATPEDVRQWVVSELKAGREPTTAERRRRKRASQGRADRTVEQEALSVLKLSAEARELAAKAQHISTRQLMDALNVEELPKGKRHETPEAVYCRNGSGWWKLPLSRPVDVPLIATPAQSSDSGAQLVAISAAAQLMGKDPKGLSVALCHAKSGRRKAPKGNGWHAEAHPTRGMCLIRRVAA